MSLTESSTESNSARSGAQKTVAISLDGVIANWVKGLRSHVATRRGVADQQLAENVSWHLAEWGITDSRTTLREFMLSPMMGRLRLMGGAATGIARLREAGFAVLVLTRRERMAGDDPADKAAARETTRKWFAGQPQLGIGDDDIVFTDDPVSERQTPTSGWTTRLSGPSGSLLPARRSGCCRVPGTGTHASTPRSTSSTRAGTPSET